VIDQVVEEQVEQEVSHQGSKATLRKSTRIKRSTISSDY